MFCFFLFFFFFFSSRRRHTRSVSAFLLNRSSDLRRRLRSFAASWLLNALLRIFAMSIITPKRKVLRMSVQDCWRSEERFSRNAETDLVCRLLLEKKKNSVRACLLRTTYSHDRSLSVDT